MYLGAREMFLSFLLHTLLWSQHLPFHLQSPSTTKAPRCQNSWEEMWCLKTSLVVAEIIFSASCPRNPSLKKLLWQPPQPLPWFVPMDRIAANYSWWLVSCHWDGSAFLWKILTRADTFSVVFWSRLQFLSFSDKENISSITAESSSSWDSWYFRCFALPQPFIWSRFIFKTHGVRQYPVQTYVALSVFEFPFHSCYSVHHVCDFRYLGRLLNIWAAIWSDITDRDFH